MEIIFEIVQLMVIIII